MLGRRLKPKKLASATLSETWPKPVFAFKGAVGQLPIEAQPYVFVSRCDAKTGRHTVVPEMLYPIEANRQPVPLHLVLEDEYRAFHNVMVNQNALKDKFVPKEPSSSKTDHVSVMRQRVVNINSLICSGRLSKEMQDKLPPLLAYNPAVDPPPGFIYRRYKNGFPNNEPKVDRLRRPPLVNIRAPFQNVVNLYPPQHCVSAGNYDSAVIGGGPHLGDVRVYNEPDAVSSMAVQADFGNSLSDRARRRGRKSMSGQGAGGK